jgi:hypothetical protein
MRRFFFTGPAARLSFVTALFVLALAGTAFATLQGLPADGSQVNNDAAAGINPGLSVSGEGPANSDVVGGSLAAGKVNAPWAILRQQTSGADQVFSRSFAAGAWTTRGAGTVGGRSSAAPTFSGSLNFAQGQDGEAPSIDFAGAGRAVPWATWYEDTTGTGFGAENIFASRFDSNQNKWIFAGQSRGLGGGTVPVPSLNIHTNRNAENPSVAGGATSSGANPGPWVTWQEEGAAAPGVGEDQIFVVKPVGPGTTECPTAKPAPAENVVVGGFCWQQVGTERLGTDPSLNVDRGREAVEPDIAFTGPGDTVPWVVWYEEGPSINVPAGHSNQLVFAAKAVGGSGDGGFHWQVVGRSGTGVLDASEHGGPCGESGTAEGACSLNANPAANAEDPRVAAGTMTAGSSTVPWVAWDEVSGAVNQIFVARLVGANFVLANDGAPISTTTGSSTLPDITFSGNTPYVTWHENSGGVDTAFAGHFVNAADPTFVLDQANVPLAPAVQADVREPISSPCTANPFNADGAACQGGALGTPFFLTTNAIGGHLALFGNAYQSGAPTTGDGSAVSAGSATVNGTVYPEGAPVTVQFQYGTSTAYGQSTDPQAIGAVNVATPFSATLSGLDPGSTVHYRAVVNTDFGTVFGADRTLPTSSSAPAGNGSSSGTGNSKTPKLDLKIAVAKEPLAKLLKTGKLGVTATVDAKASVSLSGAAKLKVRKHGKVRTKLVPVFTPATASLGGAGSQKFQLKLSAKGRKKLATLSKATLVITGTATAAGAKATGQGTATLSG